MQDLYRPTSGAGRKSVRPRLFSGFGVSTLPDSTSSVSETPAPGTSKLDRLVWFVEPHVEQFGQLNCNLPLQIMPIYVLGVAYEQYNSFIFSPTAHAAQRCVAIHGK